MSEVTAPAPTENRAQPQYILPAGPSADIPLLREPMYKVTCSRADACHTPIKCQVNITCVDEVARSIYLVLTTCTRRDLPLTKKEFVILMEQCLLRRAYELMLVFFPAQNPVTQLYLPSLLSVPGPIADLLVSLSHDLGVVN